MSDKIQHWDILAHIPLDARWIARKWMAIFEKQPSEAAAQKLEDIGIPVDFSNADWDATYQRGENVTF